ncbi:MAG: hypothetical protein K0R25_614 [Rickettsiaceae bacterium]|nr:hypothetical protein [Rickettsiaceae bacterium]
MRIIIKLFLLIMLASCQAKSGNKSVIKLYNADLQKGVSLNEITKNYGDYSKKWKDNTGRDLYQYSFSTNRYDLISYLPIINHFGWIKSENYEVLLVFDKKNLLIEKKRFYNRAKSRNSLVCNPEIYSCLRKIY